MPLGLIPESCFCFIQRLIGKQNTADTKQIDLAFFSTNFQRADIGFDVATVGDFDLLGLHDLAVSFAN